jgi:signal transduction histidine kinase
LLVFAVVVAYVTLWLRHGLRQQVLDREAEALTEVASMQLANEADTMASLGVNEVPGELLNAVLKTSKLRGVFAVRVFDSARHFSGAVPYPWTEDLPSDRDWNELQAGHALARLNARESAADVLGLPSAPVGRTTEPLLETWLPLRRSEGAPFAGAAQMWINGRGVAEEFAALDRRLIAQAVIAWAAGAVIISVMLLWAFRRLDRANRQLQARTEDLLRANRELTLAAKTSALGAVTAHLMHELKNPVAGLEEFVAARSEAGGGADDGGELAAASELTRRLRTMINDVVGVMRDEQSGVRFDLTAGEVVELALAKVAPIAKTRGAQLHSTVTTAVSLDGRRANLAGLVLHNLLQNAIEATAPGTVVTLSAAADDHVLRLAVEDEGPGLSAAVRQRLFQPCSSSKAGGTGLGLALSQQLARQAGGRIELVRSSGEGTCFELILDLVPEG